MNKQKYKIRPTDIAAWFRHRCDRNFRWNTVPGRLRGHNGIGWGVPTKVKKNTRPGIIQLMNAGYNFEADEVEALINQHGSDKILYAGFKNNESGRRSVEEISLDQCLERLKHYPLPLFIAQLEMHLTDEQESKFLVNLGLDPLSIELSPARPDLVEVLPPESEGLPYKLRIWDYKAAAAARHEHFIQVAYYSYLLDLVVRESGLSGIEVDLDYAVIHSREPEPEKFELAPYRLAVYEFLREYVPKLFATKAVDANFHIQSGCMICEYADHCRSEADAGFDLSRIAYISSESRKQLRQVGIRTHRELAQLNDIEQISQISKLGYDLTVNLERYIKTAQALEDGQPRSLNSLTLLMPRWEDIRIVISVEHDPVTNTCFALGLKTLEGWEERNGLSRPIGRETVFVAEEKGKEGEILYQFLSLLNELLEGVDAHNRSLIEASEQTIDPDVLIARQQLEATEAALASFKSAHPRLVSSNPTHQILKSERERLQQQVTQYKENVKELEKRARIALYKGLKRLHFYFYDSIDLAYLRGLIERNLFSNEPAGLLVELTKLVRMFPTESVIPDAETFRSMPGTVVTNVLRVLVALPIPYQLDLRSVSEHFRPQKTTGQEGGYTFRCKFGFVWDLSNQVAFERIHDVWENKNYKVEGQFDFSPSEVLQEIKTTVVAKLRATDSIVQRLKQAYERELLLIKEPFQFYSDFNPLDFHMLEALRVFAIMENSLNELDIKHIHTLPIEDRNNKFVCICGLTYDATKPTTDDSLWFNFDPISVDAKFEVGDYNLVVTPVDEPDALVSKVDGKLFAQKINWALDNYKVSIKELDLVADPPCIRLMPNKPDKFRQVVDLSKPCVLDQIYTDYNTPKVLKTLECLQDAPIEAKHIHDLLNNEAIVDWQPIVSNSHIIKEELCEIAATTNTNESILLNPGQWRAFHGVFASPLTLIWGPPGTGKTHTLAHILLGYALAAQHSNIKILVTAFTHHAIVNVIKKVADLAIEYGFTENVLLLKQVRGSGNAAHDELPDNVPLIDEQTLGSLISNNSGCLVVGATVWSVYKAMDKAGGIVQQWFDVVLVDEASQMKLTDALIAFSSSTVNSNIILAGDDKQLPPIIHGVYPEEHEHMLSSVFAFVRNQIELAKEHDLQAEDRRLFQLEDNFRMNEPLTAYPRELLYRGRFNSIFPNIRMITEPAIDINSPDIMDNILLPNRPVVLCWYTSPRSFTARNHIEAELIAEITARLSNILYDNGEESLYTSDNFAKRGVAILSPHRAQNSAIKQVLSNYGFGTNKPMPLVDTVDKLQGKEREVILVSYGVADIEYATAEAEFLLKSNRFNVAITRAQKKVIVFCSEQVLNVVPPDQKVLLDSMMLKEFRRYCSDGHIILPWHNREGIEIQLHIQWRAFSTERELV